MPLNRISRHRHLVRQGSSIGPYSYNTCEESHWNREGGTVPQPHRQCIYKYR
ncbi:Bgt-50061 [Blumeria graminis f. sp. tritici]|uniref:Bgt-50061 n=1 Tax=Blumeria graminis f. sp. tritici TaxID=62690 RepID=A0A9X9MJ70_BLUGR|nr:Bgt-50061 [Blumeria graminis f. sp. tritici]